jgi:hypothetical protein
MWWSGMILSKFNFQFIKTINIYQFSLFIVVVGEACNFVAYAFTQAILVTPLGALSVVLR